MLSFYIFIFKIDSTILKFESFNCFDEISTEKKNNNDDKKKDKIIIKIFALKF